jgi:hypothetical protein
MTDHYSKSFLLKPKVILSIDKVRKREVTSETQVND